MVELDPVRGREQGGRRPGLVISADTYNEGPAGLVVMLPMTATDKRVPLHVRVEPPEGGLSRTSFVKVDDVRSVSTRRLGRRFGVVSAKTMDAVETSLRVLLEL